MSDAAFSAFETPGADPILASAQPESPQRSKVRHEPRALIEISCTFLHPRKLRLQLLLTRTSADANPDRPMIGTALLTWGVWFVGSVETRM